MAEYCLRWNNYLPNLVNVFSELLQAEGLVDVTLATEGHHIRAHKLVLSACSVYFKELFGLNPCTHPIVFLKDIRYEDLKTVIDFIYKGEVNVAQERLPDVLKTAESLKIKGLADKPFNAQDQSSQGRVAPLSSSLGSQMSSLSDCREQGPSVDAEETCESPASKRRKIACQDSTESQHDSGRDSEERSRCTESKDHASPQPDKDATEIVPKIKQEAEGAPGTSDTNPETESGAVDAMLLLQGSSSETETTTGRTSSSNGRDSASLLAAQAQGNLNWSSLSLSHWWASVLPALARQQHHLAHSPQSPSPPAAPTAGAPSAVPMHHPQLRYLQHHTKSPRSLLGYTKASSGSSNNSRESSPASVPTTGPLVGSLDQVALVSAIGKEISPQMVQALQAVASRRESFSSAAKIYAVSVTTLWRYFKKLGLSENASK